MDIRPGRTSRLRVLIVEPQALVANDLAEGMRQCAPDVDIVIHNSFDDLMARDEQLGPFDLAFVATELADHGTPGSLDRIEKAAGKIIIVGDKPMLSTDALRHERIGWPISDWQLAEIVARVTSGA